MADPLFFTPPTAITLAEIATLTGAELGTDCDPNLVVTGAASIEGAKPGDVCFVEHARLLPSLTQSKAAACFCPAELAAELPGQIAALVIASPIKAFAVTVHRLYPEASRPLSVTGMPRRSPTAYVDPTARLEDDVTVEPGAVVGPEAEIGRGTQIGPAGIVGPKVRIGRHCSIGAGTSVQHALVGDRVVLHPGVRIGQDGFGFVPGSEGHTKFPQIGRVVIQSDVEIGANSCVDRGSIRDTVIGEGTKIDNLVQIAHNVVIGRHCLIAGQVGISGSVTIGDFVAIGGGAGLSDHLTIGNGAKISASAGLMRDVPPGAMWGGTPARPIRDYFRMLKALERLAFPPSKGDAARDDEGSA